MVRKKCKFCSEAEHDLQPWMVNVETWKETVVAPAVLKAVTSRSYHVPGSKFSKLNNCCAELTKGTGLRAPLSSTLYDTLKICIKSPPYTQSAKFIKSSDLM